MSSFQPNEVETRNIVQVLRDSRSPNPQVNAAIQQQLEVYNQMTNFNGYLAFIMSQMKSEPEEIRSVAGLLLKQNIRNYFDKLGDILKFIQQALLQALLDPSKLIRNTSSICIATMTRAGGLACWFKTDLNLPQCLCQLLDSGDLGAVEGSLMTISKVCEDAYSELSREVYGHPVNFLVPKLLTFFSHSEPNIRRLALHSVVSLLQTSRAPEDGDAGVMNAILANIDPFLQGIFALANDQNKEIKKDVCRAFVALLDSYVRLKPFIQDVIKYMMHQTQATEEDLALEACEFWSGISELESAAMDLKPFIPQLLPILLKGMVYNDMDKAMLGGDDDDAHVADKEENIHPHLINKAVKQRVHNKQHQQGGDDEDDDDDDIEEVSEWNLRKCSASSLDVLSNMYGDPILEVLLPLIQERMHPAQPWEIRESAILALGAVAEGCYSGMRPHLAQLVPFMIGILNTDRKPLVRSITCWSLSRYSRWIVSQPYSDAEKYFQPMLQVLMQRMLDNNKRVQEAACSAFATLEEEAQSDLVPFLKPILECLSQCFGKYQAKNLFILYDAVVTLAEAVRRKLNEPELAQLLMPPLVMKWQSVKDDDRALFPLLSCLTSVAQAMGPGFLPYADGVFRRCVGLVQTYYTMQQMRLQNPQIEMPDREFVVSALDMLSGLADGLEGAVEPFVANTNILQLVGEAIKDEASDIRQSAFAFIGDLAKTCITHLRPFVPLYMPLMVLNLVPHPVSVCNNATWAIGEIAVKVENDMRPFIPEIVNKLVPIMNSTINRNLLENTGITLGRLGLVCPDLVAPRLQEFIQPWCFNLRNIRNDVEKEHAFQGVCQMIRLNPGGAFPAFAFICDALASWGNPRHELKEEFRAILQGFRQHIGDQWPQYVSQFPPILRNHLSEVYGLS
jgi:transportin-1